MQGLCIISAHLWTPQKAGVRHPILISSSLNKPLMHIVIHTIYVGVWSPPAPSSCPTPPRLRGTEAGRSRRMLHCPDPPGDVPLDPVGLAIPSKGP